MSKIDILYSSAGGFHWIGHAQSWPSKEKNWELSRNNIFSRHQDWALMLARILFSQFRVHCAELADYEQYAVLGLIDAIDRFDPNRGSGFRYYARHRIRGTILNGVIKYSEKSQLSKFKKQAMKDRSRSLLSKDKGIDPKLELVNHVLSLTVGLLLDSDTDSSDVTLLDNTHGINEALVMSNRLWELCTNLKEKTQKIIRLHYQEDLSFTDIANKMSLSKSRVSQLHKEGVTQLKALLDWF